MIAEKDFAGRQSLGTRETQEDAYALSRVGDNGVLAVVADGMGGHQTGERASELALASFVAAFQKSDGGGDIPARLSQSLDGANAAIAKELAHEPALAGMGTTLLAAVVTPACIEWVSVGDSPLYLWRGNRLTQLNEDHSLRPILREITGRSDIAPVSTHMLRAALTGGEIALKDQSPKPVPLRAGDVIVAATDGIHALSKEQIVAISTEPASIDASALAAKIIGAIHDANHPKQDNTTVAIIKFGR